MNKIELNDNKILYKQEVLAIETLTQESLANIIDEIISGDLIVEVSEEESSPNGVFLKALKNHINDQFILEFNSLKSNSKPFSFEITVDADEIAQDPNLNIEEPESVIM